MAVILSACHDRGSVQQNITLTCLSIHLLWYVTSSSFAALHVCVAHPRAFWQCAASDSIWIFANSHSLPALPLSFFSLLILNFDFTLHLCIRLATSLKQYLNSITYCSTIAAYFTDSRSRTSTSPKCILGRASGAGSSEMRSVLLR